jgi:hypothetical protein
MNGGVVQEDFGGFNPRFLGVTLKVESPEAFRVLHEFMVTEELPDGEPSLTEVALRSVLEHEVRHYHDFLISSYGGLLFRSRLTAAINAAAVLGCIRKLPGGFVPVPIGAWALLDEGRRAVQKEEWRDFLSIDAKSFQLVDIPHLSADDLTRPDFGVKVIAEMEESTLLRTTLSYLVRGYRAISRLTSGAVEPALFAPCNIYEVSALAAQIQSIWNGQGGSAPQIFLDELGRSTSWRARLWRYFWQLEDSLGNRIRAAGRKPEVAVIDQIAAMCCWCFLGNYEAQGEAASPSLRLSWLSAHLQSAGSVADSAHDVAAAWDHWDRASGYKPWRNSLTEMVESNEKATGTYYNNDDGKSIRGTIYHVFQKYRREQELLVNRLQRAPEDYVYMNRYLNLAQGEVPVPSIRIQPAGFSLSEEFLRDSIYAPIYFSSDIVIRTLSPNFRKEVDEAAFLESNMQWADLAFSEHEIPGQLRDTGKEVLENYLGKRVLFFF